MAIFTDWDSAKLPSLRPYPKSELFAIQHRMANHLGYNQLQNSYWNTRPVLERWIKEHWDEWHKARQTINQLALFDEGDFQLSPLEQRLEKLRRRGLLEREAMMIQIQRLDGSIMRRNLPAIATFPFSPGDRVECHRGRGIYRRINNNKARIQLDNGYDVEVDPLLVFPEDSNPGEQNQLNLDLDSD